MGNRYDEIFKTADKIFNEKYIADLNKFIILTDEEKEAIIGRGFSEDEYKVLVAAVEKATEMNNTQAELVAKIKCLGEVATTIAKKVPFFANLL